ncbi:MAG: ATP-dependent DNA ligase [Acidimicrobiales bacterium]|nr:MAG: ATP-dependent DNA ligase [Acidimicrobiales bacterium]
MGSTAVEHVVGDRVVRISSPDRVYFPELGLTKLDLVLYYCSVGNGVLRALLRRPCTLHRFPEGIEGEAIYQKRVPKGAPDWLKTATVTFPSGRTADQLCVTELASVVWAVQMSTVEFHPWPVAAAQPDCPDELRIDLDPQPGTGFSQARKAAELAQEVFDELGWTSWLKTSGGRGLHLAVAIQPSWSFVQVRRAGLALGRELERRAPQLLTVAWWKEERGQRIFFDYNQNARDRTVVSAYSIRPVSQATVSAPLKWSELADANPTDFTVQTMPERFARLGDVHAGRDSVVGASLEPLLEWVQRDERDHGLGDAPYPPNYPKMPGEPPRVAPSRAKHDS